MAIRLSDQLVQALTSHNLNGVQAAVMQIINDRIGIMKAAAATDDAVLTELTTKYGQLIQIYVDIDRTKDQCNCSSIIADKLPNKGSRVL